MGLSEAQPLLFVGLGNPGPAYAMTRHNLGALVVQAFAQHFKWVFKEDRRFNALVVKGLIQEKTVHLLLPLTYMNLSGVAVRRYIDYFKIPVSRLVIVTDDIALAFGRLLLKMMGSAGGHNGLKSVQEALGTSHYMRLRMGVGQPLKQQELTDYVLGTFNVTEREELSKFIDLGVAGLKRLLTESPAQVMNVVNTISLEAKPELKSNDLTKPPLQG